MKAATMANARSSAVRTLSNTEANEAPAVAPTIAGIAKRDGVAPGQFPGAVESPHGGGAADDDRSRLEALATTWSMPMAIATRRSPRIHSGGHRVQKRAREFGEDCISASVMARLRWRASSH